MITYTPAFPVGPRVPQQQTPVFFLLASSTLCFMNVPDAGHTFCHQLNYSVHVRNTPHCSWVLGSDFYRRSKEYISCHEVWKAHMGWDCIKLAPPPHTHLVAFRRGESWIRGGSSINASDSPLIVTVHSSHDTWHPWGKLHNERWDWGLSVLFLTIACEPAVVRNNTVVLQLK